MKLHSIFVLPNYKKEGTADVVRRVCFWAGENGVKLVMLQEHESKLQAVLRNDVTFMTDRSEKKLLTDCGLVLTIGGDGTLIRGAAYAARYRIPITGVNTGTLGFLADIYPHETEEKLDRFLH